MRPDVRIRAAAESLGFLACGFADLGPSERGDAFDRWLARGYAGTMRYLHRQAAKRKQPALIVPGATTAIVVLDNYLPPPADPPGGPEPQGGKTVKIAKYARGEDYHHDCRRRLDRLSDVAREVGATVARSFVDAGPVPERELARRAGLGWIGKNTMLIRPGVGSYFFIGAVLCDLALPLDQPFRSDHCGTCSRCLDACPTGAFPEPGVLDATRCISYLTIEHKGEPPADLARRFEGWAFGCDICNDVCPWNHRFAVPTANPAYADRGDLDPADPTFFDSMAEEEFAARFGDTPLARPGLVGMRRNYHHAFASQDR